MYLSSRMRASLLGQISWLVSLFHTVVLRECVLNLWKEAQHFYIHLSMGKIQATSLRCPAWGAAAWESMRGLAGDCGNPSSAKTVSLFLWQAGSSPPGSMGWARRLLALLRCLCSHTRAFPEGRRLIELDFPWWGWCCCHPPFAYWPWEKELPQGWVKPTSFPAAAPEKSSPHFPHLGV